MSQKELLIKHFMSGKTLTILEAIALYRIYNLKGRIHELRKDGYYILTEMHLDPTGKPYARYRFPIEELA